MNEIFEKIYNDNNTDLNESSALFEKVYTEAEMLNEMNPKLRALLAAGLIGTASLGAVSCSMPTDDPYDAQYTIEQPTPENPEEIGEIEDSEDSEEITDSEDSEEIGDNGGEETVTFESLGVQPEYFASLAGADEFEDNITQIEPTIGYSSFVYKNNEYGFVEINFDPESEHIDSDGQYNDGRTYMSYVNDADDTNCCCYYVPKNMESKFDQAIAAYNAQ